MEWSLAIVAITLLGVAAISGRLSGTPITPAIVFVASGYWWGPRCLTRSTSRARAGPCERWRRRRWRWCCSATPRASISRLLRREVGVPLRLLGIGLPLTIALGAVAAAVLLGQLSVEEAVILGDRAGAD